MIELESLCGAYKVRAAYVGNGYRIHYIISCPSGPRERFGLCNPRDGDLHLQESAARELRSLQPRELPYQAQRAPRWAIYRRLLWQVYLARGLMPISDPRWRKLSDDIGWLQRRIAEHGGEEMCEAAIEECQRRLIERFS